MDEGEKIVLWVDEEESSLTSYKKPIQKCFGNSITLMAEKPIRDLPDMVARILSEPALVALVLDERLLADGTAAYRGIELADALRRSDQKIPIYILTNHPGDIDAPAWQVEYVFDKNRMSEDAYINEISERVRRHTEFYSNLLSERERRFDELLRKSLNSHLTADEQAEFSELDYWRGKPILAQEQARANLLEAGLDRAQSLLIQLEKEIGGMKKDE